MKLAISRMVSLIATPCLLYLIYIAGSWGLADVYAKLSITVLEKWRSENIALNGDDWDKLSADLSFAL